jgi:hypothetical protein
MLVNWTTVLAAGCIVPSKLDLAKIETILSLREFTNLVHSFKPEGRAGGKVSMLALCEVRHEHYSRIADTLLEFDAGTFAYPGGAKPIKVSQ